MKIVENGWKIALVSVAFLCGVACGGAAAEERSCCKPCKGADSADCGGDSRKDPLVHKVFEWLLLSDAKFESSAGRTNASGQGTNNGELVEEVKTTNTWDFKLQYADKKVLKQVLQLADVVSPPSDELEKTRGSLRKLGILEEAPKPKSYLIDTGASWGKALDMLALEPLRLDTYVSYGRVIEQELNVPKDTITDDVDQKMTWSVMGKYVLELDGFYRWVVGRD